MDISYFESSQTKLFLGMFLAGLAIKSILTAADFDEEQ